MTEAERKKIVDAFRRLGVSEAQIFNETMRAHQLDYGLFMDPGNSEYGVSREDLYKSAKQTEDLFGAVAGDADSYAAVYTLALHIDPMAFAMGAVRASDTLHGLIREMIARAEQGGDTVCFSGADAYVSCMYEIFYKLPKKRIAVIVDEAAWKDKLTLLLPRGRIMNGSEGCADTERYDFIFTMEESSLANLSALWGRLNEGGQLLALVPYELLAREEEETAAFRRTVADEGRLASYYDGDISGREYVLLSIGAPALDGSVSIGNMRASLEGLSFHELLSLSKGEFARAGDWSFEMYAFNGIPPLASALTEGCLSMEYRAGDFFTAPAPETVSSGTPITLLPAGAVRDSGIRADLLQEGMVTRDSTLISMRPGDFVMDPSGRTFSVVSDRAVYGENWIVLRPTGAVTAEVLAMFLHGPFGQLLMETLRTDAGLSVIPERLLRFPMPLLPEETVADITKQFDRTARELAKAEEDWRQAARRAAEQMTGRRNS